MDVFVLQDILDLTDAEKLKKHFRTNREIEDFLIKNKLVTIETINKAYSILLKLPYVSLSNVEIDPEVLKVIPEKIAQRYRVIPFGLGDQIVKIAISRPADLLVKYPITLANLLEKKGLAIELFITGEVDFIEAVKQYRAKGSKGPLVKRGSLPVVFLRNQIIPQFFLKKLPKEFITKYRMVVFNQNQVGNFMVACEQPDAPLTRKILDFISRENNIKVEPYATSKDDIDYVLASYDRQIEGRPKLDIGYEKREGEEQPKEEVKKPTEEEKSLAGFLENFFKKNDESEFTVDEVPELNQFGNASKKVDSLDPQKVPVIADEKKEAGKIESDLEAGPAQQAKDQKADIESEATKANTAVDVVKPSQSAESDSKEDSGDSGTPEQAVSGVKQFEDKDLGILLEGKDVKTIDDLGGIITQGYVPKMVAAMIDYALNNKASDVHIEPGNKNLRIRCRIDGVLRDIARLSNKFHPPVISRIKILSRLKIDETRIPQDGRLDLVFKNRNVDVRVSTLPTVNGEKIVLRILDKDQTILSLEDLGMQGSAFETTVQAIGRPYGIILSTGPTGSGKSTTLYAILSRLSLPGINIVTLEDPVEYAIPGVNQCQVKPEIGFTFAAGLRSVLRQDPNIIMVGEVRDAETAGMATHAALTGHLVLSTLHTNDTAGALPRLINMGVEPFLITSAMNVVIAQRLVRRICVKCREEMKIPEQLRAEVLREMEMVSPNNSLDYQRITPELKFYYGRGCSECTQGFRGRVGLFEVMTITPEIEDLAVAKRPANEIKAASLKSGMLTMKQDGILKAMAGLTTIDEVLQATLNNS